jgi:hypothetical protein
MPDGCTLMPVMVSPTVPHQNSATAPADGTGYGFFLQQAGCPVEIRTFCAINSRTRPRCRDSADLRSSASLSWRRASPASTTPPACCDTETEDFVPGLMPGDITTKALNFAPPSSDTEIAILRAQ